MIATIAICFRYIWYNNHNLTMVTDVEASDWMKTQLASSDWLRASKSSPPFKYISQPMAASPTRGGICLLQ